MSRALRNLSLLTTAAMFLVVLMGAWVTNTGSADGCGAHWPLCHGTFMPDWDYEAIVEFSHRVVAGIAGLMTTILFLWVWRKLPKRRDLFWAALTGLAFVVWQGALGALAVLWPQPKAVLALHFGFSVMCFAGVLMVSILLYRPLGELRDLTVSPALRRWIWTVIGYTYVVMYLGAYVRHQDAALACTGWPLCNDQLLPPLTGPVGVNFIHRVGAALSVVIVIRLWSMTRAASRGLRLGGNLALLLVLLQVVSGALFPLGYYNLLTQMLHTSLITAFWGVLSYLALQIWPIRQPTQVQLPEASA